MSEALARGARGAGVTVASQAATLVIQFAGTIVLSRLLSPEDFGLVAMVVVFMAMGELLRDFGMPTAALQARTLSNQQASNVFWVTTALSALAALALVACTPLIVALYDEPRLAGIVPVMAGVLLISGLQAQYQVRLARSMRFAALAGNTVVARIMGFGSGIAAALLGWGYWALVIQLGATSLSMLLGSGLMTRWLPSRPRRGSDSMKLLRSGGNFGAAQVLGFAADNVDSLVIGAMWGAQPLGYYNRAFQLFMAPISAIFSPLTTVIIPTINRALDEGRSASDVLLRAQSAVCGFTIWILMASAATSPWLVPLLLGDQWDRAVPLIQILALGGAFRALSQTNYWAYIAHQQSRQLLLSNLVTKPLQVALIIGGAFISVEAVAWGFVLGRALSWPINLLWLQRTAGQSAMRFGLNGMRLLWAAGIAFPATSLMLGWMALTNAFAAVAGGVVLATVIYAVAIILTPGGRKEIAATAAMIRSAVARS